MSACRSCGAPIIWGLLSNGKLMPLNPEPDPDGNVEVIPKVPGKSVDIVAVHKGPDLFAAERYLSHFATCPNAKEHRR